MALFTSLVLLPGLLAQQPEAAPGKGVIYGTVLDQNGKPAKDIGLTADPFGMPLGAILPHTQTDVNGHYRLLVRWWGRYTVYADDEAAGYSQSSTGPFDVKIRYVTVSAKRPTAEFDLVLPPKAGFLDIHLTNRRTGELITDLMVEVLWAGSERIVYGQRCDSRRLILVPPNKRLLLHVRSEGYQEWPKSRGKGMPVRVASGQRMTLKVALEPSQGGR